MKNSAESKSGFSLFSIDEHRLSVGLLVLLLLSASGYGIWVAMAPFLPSTARVESKTPRKEIANAHFASKEWSDAIQILQEMLEDDPDNGFAIQRLALARERQAVDKWNQFKELGATTGNSNAGNEILAEESVFFEAAIARWSDLLDNARYERTAYERLASIHARRAKSLGDPEDIEKAIEVLDAMFKNGHTTSRGIGPMRSFVALKDHSEFNRLKLDERRNFELNSQSSRKQKPREERVW